MSHKTPLYDVLGHSLVPGGKKPRHISATEQNKQSLFHAAATSASIVPEFSGISPKIEKNPRKEMSFPESPKTPRKSFVSHDLPEIELVEGSLFAPQF